MPSFGPPPPAQPADSHTYMAGAALGVADRARVDTPRLKVTEDATSDGSGNLAVVFDPVSLGAAWWGSISIPGAPASSSTGLYLNTQQVATLTGANPWGPLVVLPGERLSLLGTGYTPATQYAAVFLGVLRDGAEVGDLVAATVPQVVAVGGGEVDVDWSPVTVETDYQSRTDYQPVYLGTATPGTALSADGWAIRYLTYDGSSRLTSILNASGAWTNRTSLSYS